MDFNNNNEIKLDSEIMCVLNMQIRPIKWKALLLSLHIKQVERRPKKKSNGKIGKNMKFIPDKY